MESRPESRTLGELRIVSDFLPVRPNAERRRARWQIPFRKASTIRRLRQMAGLEAVMEAAAIVQILGFRFSLGANLIPGTGASEREGGQRQRAHTWRA